MILGNNMRFDPEGSFILSGSFCVEILGRNNYF